MRAANGISETTTSIAGTLGDGAVTLTAIANTPRISSAFGTGAVVVRYTIAKGTTGAFETGIGSVAANVLTRTKPTGTWSGAAWVDTGTVTALQFGATPTSGDVIVRLAPLAEERAPTIPAIQTLVVGDATWRDYPFSGAIQTANGSGSAATLTADREHYFYYKLEHAGKLLGIQYEVITGVSSSVKVALYSVGSTGLPEAKIVDFVPTSLTTTGVKTDTATASWTPTTGITLTPGWYVIGFLSNGAASLAGTSGANSTRLTPLGRRNTYGYSGTIYVAGNYTTGLPASPNLTGGTIVDPGASFLTNMLFGLKVQP